MMNCCSFSASVVGLFVMSLEAAAFRKRDQTSQPPAGYQVAWRALWQQDTVSAHSQLLCVCGCREGEG